MTRLFITALWSCLAGLLEELLAREHQAGITPDPEVGLHRLFCVCPGIIHARACRPRPALAAGTPKTDLRSLPHNAAISSPPSLCPPG